MACLIPASYIFFFFLPEQQQQKEIKIGDGNTDDIISAYQAELKKKN